MEDTAAEIKRVYGGPWGLLESDWRTIRKAYSQEDIAKYLRRYQ